MTIGDVLVKAVLMAILLAVLAWFRHATWRARLWAVGLWAVVMALGIWWFSTHDY